MATSTPAHSTHALPTHTAVVAWFFVAACVVGGVWVALTAASNEWPILGPVILFACALLVAVGVFAAGRGSRWLAVALVTVGALVVGTLFFWTILASILAIALIVLFVIDARRGSSVAATPAI
jgi:hypothetical protein